jgi:hypothetical protein
MTIGRYARDTYVRVEKSMADLRKVVQRYGAKEFGVFDGETSCGVMFTVKGIRIKIALDLPTPEAYRRNSTGALMGSTQAKEAHQKAVRQRWRALVLVVTAKLEAVESGIETVEQAFMPYLVMSNGQTMGEMVMPQIAGGQLKLLGGVS